MLQTFKPRPAYYSVHALRDQTIWLASPGRKPSRQLKPQIDEDGIYEWVQDEDDPIRYNDWAKSVWHGAVVNSLNTKRIVRHQVEAKLDSILQRLEDIQQRLARLEQR